MIYLYDTHYLNLNDESLFKDLPADRIEKINRLMFEEDKKLSLGAGLLLNFAVKDYCENHGIPCPEFPIDIYKGEHGKPMLKYDNIHFNLSHSGRYVVCTVDKSPVGIDIQKIGKTVSAFGKKIMTDKENEIFGTDIEDTLKVFCMKEAILKRMGVGLSFGFQNIELFFENINGIFESKARLFPSVDDGIYYVEELKENVLTLNSEENIHINTAVLEDEDSVYLLAQC